MYVVRTEKDNKIIGWFDSYGDAFDRLINFFDDGEAYIELVDDDKE